MRNLVLMLLISVGLTSAAKAGAEPTTSAHNERFGFSITYRADLFGEAVDNSADGSGPAAALSNGRAGFSASGMFAFETLAESYRDELAKTDQVITYKTINPSENYFVVAGFRGGNVFYVKSYVINGVIKTLSIWYDAKLKSTYDKETVAMSLYGFNPRLPSDP